jgi:hypothetical protein
MITVSRLNSILYFSMILPQVDEVRPVSRPYQTLTLASTLLMLK